MEPNSVVNLEQLAREISDCYNKQNYDSAKSHIDLYLDLGGNNPIVYHLLGNILYFQKQYHQSINIYLTAFQAGIKNSLLYKKIGRIYEVDLKEPELAIKYYNKFLLFNAGDVEAEIKIGLCYFDLMQYEKSIIQLKRFKSYLVKNDFQSKCYCNALSNLKQFEEIKNFLLEKNQTTALTTSDLRHLAKACFELANYRESIETLQKLMAYLPEDLSVITDLACSYRHLHQVEYCIEVMQQVVDISTDYYPAYLEMARAYSILGKYEEAMKILYKCQNKKYEHEINVQLAFVNLLFENYHQGWLQYESRLKSNSFNILPASLKKMKQWQGEEIAGKKLYVYCEQGFGDAIQFSRYFSMIEEQSKSELIIITAKPLISLFKEWYPSYEILDTIQGKISDYIFPLMSSPFIFQTNSKNIPVVNIKSENSKKNESSCLRVGMLSSGNVKNPNNYRRNIDDSLLMKALSVKGCEVHALGTEPLKLKSEASVHEHYNEFSNFLELSHLVETMDLIVTVDTALAHLSASLGKETWVLINSHPDWRWGLLGDSNDWYSSIKLYRQTSISKWDDILDVLHHDLLDRVKGIST